MTDRYAELRAALDAATPGPWRALSPTEKHYLYYLTGDPSHNWSAAAVSGIGRALRFDAIYIAAANPEVIRALLAERDSLAAECLEQSRLNGMGAEREARLLAERDALREALLLARDRIESERRSGEIDLLLHAIDAALAQGQGGSNAE